MLLDLQLVIGVYASCLFSVRETWGFCLLHASEFNLAMAASMCLCTVRTA